MIRAVKGDRKALVQRYGISPRLAARIEALGRRHVGVTRQVLEICRPASTAEAALMAPQLLRKADRLDDETLAAILRSSAGDRADSVPPMQVIQRGTSRIIALAMERTPPAEESLLPSNVRDAQLSRRVLGGPEAAALFSPQDVARLKLVILTSTNADEKVTAIRQLTLVPAGLREKGAVLLGALRDESARVRSEAAGALVALGLEPGIADAARALAAGNDSQRLLAAQRITSIVAGVSEGEMAVLLTLLAGSLAGEESVNVRLELIAAARAAVPAISRKPQHAAELVRILLDQARAGIPQLRRPISETLADLGQAEPDVVGTLCWDELSHIRQPHLRRFLLTVMGRFGLPRTLQDQVLAAALAEIVASPKPEEDCLELGSALCRWPQKSADLMLDAIEQAPDAAKLYLVRLLDEVAARGELSCGQMQRIGQMFLRLLQVAEKNVRTALLQADAVYSPTLPPGLRGKLAAELLTGLGQYGSVRLLDTISNSIVRIGQPSCEPLVELIRGDENRLVRRMAARMLGNTVAAIPKGKGAAAAVKQMVKAGIEMLDEPRMPQGALAAALGRMCTHPLVDGETIERVAGELTDRIKLGSEAFGVLEGLGALVLNPATSLAIRLDVAQRFFELLDSSLPDVETQETVVNDQRVYSFGSSVSAYTEMVPVVLGGLENSFLGAPDGPLRKQIGSFLVQKWAEVSSWETIWGPDNVISLLRVLGTVACHGATHMDMKIKIVEAISKRADLIHVIEILGRIHSTEPASHRLGAKARDLAWLLIERRLTKRSLVVEDRQVIHQVLGIIGSRTSLGSDPSLARRTRERIIETLFGGLREGFSAAADALETMKDCPALGSAVRKDIAERLASFQAAHSDKVPYRPRIRPKS